MERNGNGPRKLCFGNFTFGDRECMACADRADCLDDQEGWGKFTTVSDAERTALIEDTMGGVPPDWVFEWDEILTDMTEEEIQRFLRENPDRARFYNLLNSGIQD